MTLKKEKTLGKVVLYPNEAGDGIDRVQLNWNVSMRDDVTGELDEDIGTRAKTREYNLVDENPSLPSIVKAAIQARIDV